jgi:hypothetical protein
MPKLDELYLKLAGLFEPSVASNLGKFEQLLRSADKAASERLLESEHLDFEVLRSAVAFKRAAGQINEIVHAIGILVALPYVLLPNEHVERMSLGAGNIGRGYDLETNLRVAEFKFIDWKGGSEAIRQNQFFKDFYLLAESSTTKQKQLFVVGTEHPLRFLRSKRACTSIFAGHKSLWGQFQEKYGDSITRVCEYYERHRNEVEIVDLRGLMPEFASTFGLTSEVGR